MLIELAVECGAITSIAISADHSTIAGGHANGTIFTWDTARAARPFLHIPQPNTAPSKGTQDVQNVIDRTETQRVVALALSYFRVCYPHLGCEHSL